MSVIQKGPLMKRAHLLSALGAPLFLALSISPMIALAAPPIDFETGFSKGTTVDNQYEQDYGIKFSIVNINTQAVTYPVIGRPTTSIRAAGWHSPRGATGIAGPARRRGGSTPTVSCR
jgi:hypothetical protein